MWMWMCGSREREREVLMTLQITNFFNHMAFKVDLESVEQVTTENPSHGYAPTHYDPMRRRMHVDLN
jgi:hypothetical protein